MPVVLTTMNPINEKLFLPIKGAHTMFNEFGLFPRAVSDQVRFCKTAYIKPNNHINWAHHHF